MASDEAYNEGKKYGHDPGCDEDEYEKGEKAGYARGYDAGEVDGHKEGEGEGHEQGYAEGEREGYERGYDAAKEEFADIDLTDLEDSLREKLVRPSFVLDLRVMFDRLGYLFMNRDVGL